MSSGGGTTTTTQNSAPWAGQQPYLSALFGGAQNAYNLYGGNPANSIAAFTPNQQSAFNLTQNAVGNSDPANSIAAVNNAATNYTANTLGGAGLNANPANSALTSLASGAPTANNTFGAFANGSMMNNPAANFESNLMSNGPQNPANPMLAGIAGAAGVNPANPALASFANGSQINPYLSQATQALTDPIVRAYQTSVAPGISSQMESAGRYGSGAMMNAEGQAQSNLGMQLNNAVAPFLAQQLPQQQQMQLNAAGTLGSQYLSGLNTAAGAAGQIGSNYNQGVSNQLGAASAYGGQQANILAGAQGLSGNAATGLGQLSNNYNNASQQQLQAAYNAPNISNLGWQGIGNLQNSGAQQQTLNQNILNSPFNLLNQYGSLIQGMYGQQGTTTQPYFTNPAASGLGGALLGSQLGSQLGVGSGWGAAGGGLMGLLSASDRRLKTDIKRIGSTDSGLPVYSYRYVWGGPVQFGVMADEVRKVNPEAVFNIEGFDRVNYGMLQ